MVSVIVPVYNGEKYIERCIYSILNQTYKDLEIIVINNGSIDQTSKLVTKMAKKDNRIKLINTNQKGVSIARNIGIQNATGEYIMFVDSDDTIEEKMIAEMIEILHRELCDIVKCGYKIVKSDSSVEFGLKTQIHTFDDEFWNTFFCSYDYNQLWGQLIKSHLCKKIKFDENIAMAEDYLFNYELYKMANSLYSINSSFYCYYYNEQGMNYCKDIDKIQKKINDILSVCKKIIKKEKKYEKHIYNRFLFEILPHLQELFLIEKNDIKENCFVFNDDFYINAMKNLNWKFHNNKIKYFILILLKKNKINVVKIYFRLNKFLKSWR